VSAVAGNARGIDVSNFGGDFNWAGTSGLSFGICRASQGLGAAGTNSPDPFLTWNWPRIKAKGLARGAYHFLDPRLDGARQASYFVDQLNKVGLDAKSRQCPGTEFRSPGHVPTSKRRGAAPATCDEALAVSGEPENFVAIRCKGLKHLTCRVMNRHLAFNFLRCRPGYGEAIAIGKKNKALVLKVITKQMKVTDRKRLDVIYDASLGRMPSKPYAREEAVQLELESIAFTDPLFKNKKASDFMDSSIVAELDRKGFFAQLQ